METSVEVKYRLHKRQQMMVMEILKAGSKVYIYKDVTALNHYFPLFISMSPWPNQETNTLAFIIKPKT